jgi:hypothetical protein
MLKERRAQQENNTFESWQILETSDPLSRRTFLRSHKQKFRENQGSGENVFTVKSSLFIGARGVVSRSCLDSTVASFPEDACPLQRSEGDVFYQNPRVFVETGRQSQPASPRG